MTLVPIQIRNVYDINNCRLYLHQLLSHPYFHYVNVVSDIWILYDDEMPAIILAWAWITDWTEEVKAIRMIDTMRRGNGYARKLIDSIEDSLGECLLPHDVISSAQTYWVKIGYDSTCWLSGLPPAPTSLPS